MAEQQEKIIELKNVGVTYKERKSFFKSESYEALKDISFDVYKGETLGIIGRNGAGKSTLLRLLAGIIKPDKGEVIHHCKSVSLMALAAGFDPNLSGRQNATISGMLIGHTKQEMLDKIENIKKFSELGEFFDKPVKTYSSGMRARLAFATAINTHPDVLLIDEVLAVGDANFKQKAEGAISDKVNSDITVVIVSHSEQQIKRLADRAVWVEEGVVHSEGTVEHIFIEYNLSSQLSKNNLKVENYKLEDDFFVAFEKVNVRNNRIHFDCVLVDKKNRLFQKVTISNVNGYSQILDGPKATPGYKGIFPNINQSANARYINGVLEIGCENYLSVVFDNENERKLVLKIVVI